MRGGENPQISPAALLRKLADALDRRLGHDCKVHSLSDVRRFAVEAVNDRCTGGTRTLHRWSVHEVVEDECVFSRSKQLRHADFSLGGLAGIARDILEDVMLWDLAAGRERAALGCQGFRRAPQPVSGV